LIVIEKAARKAAFFYARNPDLSSSREKGYALYEMVHLEPNYKVLRGKGSYNWNGIYNQFIGLYKEKFHLT
jgi:hypothetical protein